MQPAVVLGVVFVGVLCAGAGWCAVSRYATGCVVGDPALTGVRVVFRPRQAMRYRLGVVVSMPSVGWFATPRCVVRSGETTHTVPFDQVVRVDRLMQATNLPHLRAPILGNRFRGFTILNAFLLNSVADGVANAIGMEVHLQIPADAKWQRAVAGVLVQSLIAFAVMATLYLLWGYGSSQCANVPNIVLDAAAARELFRVQLREDEEFVVTEDNALLFPTMSSRRGSVVKTRVSP